MWPRLRRGKRGSAGSVLGLRGGGARPLSPGRRERCERAPGAYWLKWATLPGLDWAATWRGRGSAARALIGCCSLVLGLTAGKGEVREGSKGQVRAAIGGWHQFAHPSRGRVERSCPQSSLSALAGECPSWGCTSFRGATSAVGAPEPSILCNADTDAKSLSLLSFSGFCAPSSEPQQPASWRLTPPCLAFGIVSPRPLPLRLRPELRPLIGRRVPPGGLRPEKRALTAARAWRARTASPWTAATVASGRRKVSTEPVPNWTRGAGDGGCPGRWGRSELNRIKATLASHPSTKNQITPGLEGTSVGRKLRHGVGKERCLLSQTAPPPPVQLLWKAL